jgi:hypothetical protein
MYKSASRFSQSTPFNSRIYHNTKKVKMAGNKKRKLGPLLNGTVPKPKYKSVSRANRNKLKTGRILNAKT